MELKLNGFCKHGNPALDCIHCNQIAAQTGGTQPTATNSAILEIAWCLREIACVLNDVIDVPLDIKNRVDAVLAQLQQ